jgi:mono/diheme cytochrome c family protein
VFRNDPMYRAREIWDDRCAGCHGLAGAGGEKGPDLKDYNSRAWIRGFLVNPDGPMYMGPAKIEKGMRPVEASAEEMDALVEYLYAETGAADADNAKAARGRNLLSPKDCDTCHDLDGEGENDGPNLKGPRHGEVGRRGHRRPRPPAAVHRPQQDAEVRGQAERRGDRADGEVRGRAEEQITGRNGGTE